MVDLIYEYLQNQVGYALVQKDCSPRIMEILNKIASSSCRASSF